MVSTLWGKQDLTCDIKSSFQWVKGEWVVGMEYSQGEQLQGYSDRPGLTVGSLDLIFCRRDGKNQWDSRNILDACPCGAGEGKVRVLRESEQMVVLLSEMGKSGERKFEIKKMYAFHIRCKNLNIVHPT